MPVRIGINGFGRIGRNIMRAAMDDKDINFVAVNDLTSAKTLAHLLKHDSVHGNLKAEVTAKGEAIFVNGREIRVCAIKDPAALPWKELGVERQFRDSLAARVMAPTTAAPIAHWCRVRWSYPSDV